MLVEHTSILQSISTLCGWTYVLLWSASFYPQPLLNWKRKSTQGLTVDFPALNLLGFISYTISTSCFLYSPKIRQQYALRHPKSLVPTVRFNDFAFAAHALIMVIMTYSQFYNSIWPFKPNANQKMNTVTRSIILASILAVVLATFLALSNDPLAGADSEVWTWIDVIYIFGYIKVTTTFVKYIPQAWFNFKRKSTQGWSIAQILFDFAGGFLSLAQLFIDASFQADWSGVTGNPAKLALSNISLFFDVVFILQHFVLYRNTGRKISSNGEAEATREPLLSNG